MNFYSSKWNQFYWFINYLLPLNQWNLRNCKNAYKIIQVSLQKDRFVTNCGWNSKIVQISDTFVQFLNPRHFCSDFIHLMCLKTEHTKVWISDKLQSSCREVCVVKMCSHQKKRSSWSWQKPALKKCLMTSLPGFALGCKSRMTFFCFLKQ